MVAKAKTQEIVTKAVLCNVTGEPIATVEVPKNVRSIEVAGCYTLGGYAVNVRWHKVSASKKALAQLKNSGASHIYAKFDEDTETFSMVGDF